MGVVVVVGGSGKGILATGFSILVNWENEIGLLFMHACINTTKTNR